MPPPRQFFQKYKNEEDREKFAILAIYCEKINIFGSSMFEVAIFGRF